MKIKIALFSIVAVMLAALTASAQDSPRPGFIISMKNGSSIRGQKLTRDEASGKLRLAMTETSSNEPKSYAIISMDDTEAIRASASDTDSIRINLRGGSELRCKEFNLDGEKVIVKLGSASRVEILWDQIEAISFAP